ncbi:MAG TPA: hypothetical protein VGA18_00460, partial [Rhodothermales bacterium]
EDGRWQMADGRWKNVAVPLSEGAAERDKVLLRRKLQRSAQPGVVTGSPDSVTRTPRYSNLRPA